MNRRKAIGSIAVLGVGAAGAPGGWRYLRGFRRPDLRLLDLHSALIAGLAETIIPATDTPGAIEAGVPAFIVKMVREATDRRSQHNFLDGLEETERHCQDRFGRPFTECSVAERTEVLRHWAQAGRRTALLGRLERWWSGRRFYELLRNYTVIGYCTSELGATRGLAYDFIPGIQFQGCLPLQPGQRAWATF
jgi:hypothetical protein